MGRPASPCHSTMTTLAGAHFLHPPSHTSLYYVFHADGVISGSRIPIFKKHCYSNPTGNKYSIFVHVGFPWTVTAAAYQLYQR